LKKRNFKEVIYATERDSSQLQTPLKRYHNLTNLPPNLPNEKLYFDSVSGEVDYSFLPFYG